MTRSAKPRTPRRRGKTADNVVLFRAAAGPRRGFGHLVRCKSLAKALNVTPIVSLRGTEKTKRAARTMGCELVAGGPKAALASSGCRVLVVDDPIASDARRWIRAARETGRKVASVHDLGIGCLDADLVIDGTVCRSPKLDACAAEVLSGPDYAVLDPGLISQRMRRASGAGTIRVLIALGGGRHTALAAKIAEALIAADEDIEVRIAAGFVAGGNTQFRLIPRVTWVGRTNGLAEELSRADVAVVGGGVTLYEACAIGTAAVAVPVVDAQRETIASFVAKGAAKGIVDGPVEIERVTLLVLDLVRNAKLRSTLGRKASRLVDGRGATRAARAVARLATSGTKH